MNILPFIFALLIVMTLGISFLFEGAAFSASAERSFTGLFTSCRNITNDADKRAYKKAVSQHLSNESRSPSLKTPANKKGSEIRIYESRRDKKNVIDLELSKLNFALLLEEGDEVAKKDVYYAFSNLIRILYGKSPFYTENRDEHLHQKIVDMLIELAKEKREASTLTELLPERNHPLFPVMFKLIQGTRNYDLASGRGYPPLAHFARFDRVENKKPLYFYHASRPVIRAYFGEEIAELIAKAELEKWGAHKSSYQLTLAETEELLIRASSKKRDFSKTLKQTIVFGKRGSVRVQTTGFDPDSGIYITTKN